MLLLTVESYAQKMVFNVCSPEESSIADEIDSIFSFDKKPKSIRNNIDGSVVFLLDTASNTFFQVFDNQYLLIKQVPLESSSAHSASTLFVPIINAVIVDVRNPKNIYVFRGNAKTNPLEVKYFKVKRRKIIFYAQNKVVKFKRL